MTENETAAPSAAEHDTPAEGLVEALPELYGLADSGERSVLRRTLIVAAVFHLLVLLYHFPDLTEPLDLGRQQADKVYVVQELRFKPPTPRQQKQIPTPKKKRIPIPDPTPDEPEPILVEDVEIPELDMPNIGDVVFGIPDAPPGLDTGPAIGDVFQIGGGVQPPQKIFAPQPKYTETARRARVQGVVILQGVLDVEGNLRRIQVVKPLAQGLTESAVETVKTWKYKPATKDGQPVAVYLNVMVHFSLQ